MQEPQATLKRLIRTLRKDARSAMINGAKGRSWANGVEHAIDAMRTQLAALLPDPHTRKLAVVDEVLQRRADANGTKLIDHAYDEAMRLVLAALKAQEAWPCVLALREDLERALAQLTAAPSPPKGHLLSWAARLVRAVCPPCPDDIGEPVRDVAIEMKRAVYEVATLTAASAVLRTKQEEEKDLARGGSPEIRER